MKISTILIYLCGFIAIIWMLLIWIAYGDYVPLLKTAVMISIITAYLYIKQFYKQWRNNK